MMIDASVWARFCSVGYTHESAKMRRAMAKFPAFRLEPARPSEMPSSGAGTRDRNAILVSEAP